MPLWAVVLDDGEKYQIKFKYMGDDNTEPGVLEPINQGYDDERVEVASDGVDKYTTYEVKR